GSRPRAAPGRTTRTCSPRHPRAGRRDGVPVPESGSRSPVQRLPGVATGARVAETVGMKMALVTAIASFGIDADLAPLQQACADEGIDAQIVAWDDPTVSWARFDAALLRSPWDYMDHLP